MPAIPLEEDVRKNRENIAELTVGLTKLGGMVENTMEKLDRVVVSMDKQNENMSAMVGMQKDIASINEKIALQYADIAANRHDYKGVMNTIQVIPTMLEKITANEKNIVKHETRLDAQADQITDLKSWKDKCDGAGITGYKDDLEKIRGDVKSISDIAKAYTHAGHLGWKAVCAGGACLTALCGGVAWLVAHAAR